MPDDVLLSGPRLDKTVERHNQPLIDFDHRLAGIAFAMGLQCPKINADKLAGDVDGADAVGKAIALAAFRVNPSFAAVTEALRFDIIPP